MKTLPPEVWSNILDLAVLPADMDPDQFRKRTIELSRYARVSLVWAYLAQRLLFSEPVLFTWSAPASAFRAAKLFSILESENTSFSAHHLRVSGTNESREYGEYNAPSINLVPLKNGVGGRLALSLTALSLHYVELEVGILLELPFLEILSLSDILFLPSSSLHESVLERLTDLSMYDLRGPFPACLTFGQLPSLQRLATQFLNRQLSNGFFRVDTVGTDIYCMEKISNLRQRLDFFSCNLGEDEKYPSDDYSLLGDFTLFDVPREQDFIAFCHESPGSDAIQYLRVPNQPLDKDPTLVWDTDQLERLLQTKWPNLAVFVAPGAWRKEASYDEFLDLMRRKNVTVLYEEVYFNPEEWVNRKYPEKKENLISLPFKEYRRRGKTRSEGK